MRDSDSISGRAVGETPYRAIRETVTFDEVSTNRLKELLEKDIEDSSENNLVEKVIAAAAGVGHSSSKWLNTSRKQQVRQAPSFGESSRQSQRMLSISHTENDEKEVDRPKIVGMLVSYDRVPAGEIFPLREGRSMISSSDSAHDEETIVIHDSSVSVSHASIRVSEEGNVDIVDNLSKDGTFVYHMGSDARQSASTPCSLSNGDSISIGNRIFHICLVLKSLSQSKADGSIAVS